MAVPPADDGQVAVVDRPAAKPRSSSTLTILSAAFAVVVVACLGVLVVRYVNDTEGSSVGDRVQQLFGAGSVEDDAAGREAVMSQADQFMLRINTYGPSDLDKQNTMPGYTDGVHEVITPKFAASFDQNVTLAEQSVAQAGYARSVQLFSTGVDTMDDDSATVLVSGVIKGSYPDSRSKGRVDYPEQPFRVTVSMVKIEGTWLVDDFTPVTDGSDQDPTAGQPTAPATSQPTKKPTGKPTGKPTTKSTGGAKP